MRTTFFTNVDRFHIASSQIGMLLATVVCLTFALGFALLGGWLIVCGFGAVIGVFFTGHGLVVAAMVALGLVSLAVAIVLCAVPILLLITHNRTQETIRDWEMWHKNLKGK